MKFLQEDTFLTGFLSRLIDILLMSVLWLLTSIPVITIGASTTALYDVSLHLVLDDRSGIVLNFLRSMKRNFGRATLVWLLFIASGLFLGTDLWAAFHWDTPFRIVHAGDEERDFYHVHHPPQYNSPDISGQAFHIGQFWTVVDFLSADRKRGSGLSVSPPSRASVRTGRVERENEGYGYVEGLMIKIRT